MDTIRRDYRKLQDKTSVGYEGGRRPPHVSDARWEKTIDSIGKEVAPMIYLTQEKQSAIQRLPDIGVFLNKTRPSGAGKEPYSLQLVSDKNLVLHGVLHGAKTTEVSTYRHIRDNEFARTLLTVDPETLLASYRLETTFVSSRLKEKKVVQVDVLAENTPLIMVDKRKDTILPLTKQTLPKAEELYRRIQRVLEMDDGDL